MPRKTLHLALDDSEVAPRPGARPVRQPRGDRPIRVTIVLKPRPLPTGHPIDDKAHRIRSAPPHHRPHLTRQELVDLQRPDEAHVRAVRRFARANGLTVLEVSRARHHVVLTGPLKAIAAAFQVEFRHYVHGRHRFRTHAGPICLPADLRGAVESVLGLDTMPLHDRAYGEPAGPATLSPRELAAHYRFPPGTTGRGQRIVLIEFAGGYHPRDIEEFFKAQGTKPPPIADCTVNGARNDPMSYQRLKKIAAVAAADPAAAYRRFGDQMAEFGTTLEVTMDVQIVASLAPGAEIVVLFAPPDGQGWRDALYAAVDDWSATVVSLSWGDAEYVYSESQVRGIEDALHAACLRQVTVCCASGDFGSRGTSGITDANGMANVAFPASSPAVLACGGSALRREGRESVWNAVAPPGGRFATGGGISGRFALPDFQERARVPRPSRTWLSRRRAADHRFRGRGVPDVASHAALAPGYRLRLGGQVVPGGGTSAVAPLWAALIARLNEALGYRLGWANAVFYSRSAARTFRRITTGNNDVCDGKIAYYQARRGWNACTGLGTPDGVRLLSALRGISSC